MSLRTFWHCFFFLLCGISLVFFFLFSIHFWFFFIFPLVVRVSFQTTRQTWVLALIPSYGIQNLHKSTNKHAFGQHIPPSLSNTRIPCSGFLVVYVGLPGLPDHTSNLVGSTAGGAQHGWSTMGQLHYGVWKLQIYDHTERFARSDQNRCSPCSFFFLSCLRSTNLRASPASPWKFPFAKRRSEWHTSISSALHETHRHSATIRNNFGHVVKEPTIMSGRTWENRHTKVPFLFFLPISG